MIEFIENNPELTAEVIGAIVVGLVGLFVKWGYIQKKRGDELTGAIEELKPRLAKALREQPKDGEIDVAALATSVLKTTVRERAIKAGVSTAMAIADGAAKVDPDPEKKPRPILRFLGGLVLSRLGVPRK